MSSKTNPYLNPEQSAHLDSFEGLYVPLEKSAINWADKATFAKKVNALLEYAGVIMPGVIMALILALAGKHGSQWLGITVMGFQKSPVSSIMVAVVLGILIRNLFGMPTVYSTGLRFCLRNILRIGVALLGIRLSIMAVGKIGIISLPVVVVCIACALLLVSWINNRMGLPRRLGSLIAVGTSICGASAIVATGPIINADEDEISYAVACITIFGMIAMLIYPFLSFWLFNGDAHYAGIFLGTAIHDTSQVAGAGLMYQEQFDAPQALNVAAVTKLIRNLFMIVVIPLMAVVYHRSGSTSAVSVKKKWYRMIPLFIVGFLAMATLRTLGDVGDKPFQLIEQGAWNEIISFTKMIASWCLTIAMAAVGLRTSFSKLRNLGLKPLMVGLIAATVVGLVSFSVLKIISLTI